MISLNYKHNTITLGTQNFQKQVFNARRNLVVKAQQDTAGADVGIANKAFKFLKSTDFNFKQWGPYKQYLQKYVEDPKFKNNIGFKPLPERINGRGAMLGFVTFIIPDLLGRPVFQQIAAGPQAVILVFTLLTIASFVPVYKDGDKPVTYYLDQYSIPEDIFSESNERAVGRLAMSGLGTIILLEFLLGRALL